MTEIDPIFNSTQKILTDEDRGMYDPLYKPLAAKVSPTKALNMVSPQHGFYDPKAPFKEFGPQEPIEIIPDEIMAAITPGRSIDNYETAIISTIRRMNRWFAFKEWCERTWSACKDKFASLAFWQRAEATENTVTNDFTPWQQRYLDGDTLKNLERVIKCYDQFGLLSFDKDQQLQATWEGYVPHVEILGKLAGLPTSLREKLPSIDFSTPATEKADIINQVADFLDSALDACYSEYGSKMTILRDDRLNPSYARSIGYVSWQAKCGKKVPFLTQGMLDSCENSMAKQVANEGKSFSQYKDECIAKEKERVKGYRYRAPVLYRHSSHNNYQYFEKHNPQFLETTVQKNFADWQQELEEFFANYVKAIK